MFAWIIQIILMSLIFILLVHNIIGFFKDTLTVPKVKDLVFSNNQKYKEIFNTINNCNSQPEYSNTTDINELLPKEEINMKDELKNFLKSQMQT